MENKMTEQEFSDVVAAILDGKYSWACLLILEAAGYNPLHYMPRRTYHRLRRENLPEEHAGKACASPSGRAQIRDLACVETVSSAKQTLRGGLKRSWHQMKLEQRSLYQDWGKRAIAISHAFKF